jgi:hypothetical protein
MSSCYVTTSSLEIHNLPSVCADIYHFFLRLILGGGGGALKLLLTLCYGSHVFHGHTAPAVNNNRMIVGVKGWLDLPKVLLTLNFGKLVVTRSHLSSGHHPKGTVDGILLDFHGHAAPAGNNNRMIIGVEGWLDLPKVLLTLNFRKLVVTCSHLLSGHHPKGTVDSVLLDRAKNCTKETRQCAGCINSK